MYEEYIEAIDRERIIEHVRRITEIAPQRLSGSPEERKIVAYFQEVLGREKIPVKVYEIDGFVSFPREGKIELLSPQTRTLPCSTFAQICSTGEEGLEGKVVYAGQGGFADYEGLDVRGKIVLVVPQCQGHLGQDGP